LDDSKLKRIIDVRNGGLVPANAREDLHRSDRFYHLLTKGIVYRKATLEVISLREKMFNHNMGPASDARH
jgi:uncharacterized protein YceH (UPF0502 family)